MCCFMRLLLSPTKIFAISFGLNLCLHSIITFRSVLTKLFPSMVGLGVLQLSHILLHFSSENSSPK